MECDTLHFRYKKIVNVLKFDKTGAESFLFII
ncbi:hypothetical protein BC670_0266 [Flavobacterium branchiophilum]|uniref:Uncharacterized protein n=1 Tax=Flavobacterium branchiophilum TaxID=55197 RepID=A0A543G067_9FLAO|nr:hypothetical protein BC670_0266 [Flavobacterium branchiophilum]